MKEKVFHLFFKTIYGIYQSINENNFLMHVPIMYAIGGKNYDEWFYNKTSPKRYVPNGANGRI